MKITRQTTTGMGDFHNSYSILLRRLNGGVLDLSVFTAAVTALQDEVVNSEEFLLFTIGDAHIFASISLMKKHNLNATDAAILTTLLEYAQSLDAPQCVLIAADKRLLRAAGAEGIVTLNPETHSAADAVAFLASLSPERHAP